MVLWFIMVLSVFILRRTTHIKKGVMKRLVKTDVDGQCPRLTVDLGRWPSTRLRFSTALRSTSGWWFHHAIKETFMKTLLKFAKIYILLSRITKTKIVVGDRQKSIRENYQIHKGSLDGQPVSIHVIRWTKLFDVIYMPSWLVSYLW